MIENLEVHLEFPKALARKLWKDEKEAASEIKKAAILDLVRLHRISLRRGAELLEITYRDFLELMKKHRVPAIDYEAGWLEEEDRTFQELDKEHV